MSNDHRMSSRERHGFKHFAHRCRFAIEMPSGAFAMGGAALLLALLSGAVWATELAAPGGEPWARRQISEPGLDGSDGTKFADVDGDGLLDVATAFESEGVTRLFRNPGPAAVRQQWPAVVVGRTPKAEDAAFVDLDQDGAVDVVTSSEKGVEQVFVHWGPNDRRRAWEADAWTQSSIDAARGATMWMFAEPILLAPATPIALAVGGKNYRHDQSAILGLLIPGPDPRAMSEYRWRELARVSWVMSIVTTDMNGDGYVDILYSDKHGPGCGVWWLENPGARGGNPVDDPWSRHAILAEGLSGCMLLDVVDVDRDGLRDIVVPVELSTADTDEADPAAQKRIAVLLRRDATGLKWESTSLRIPPGTASGKAATAGDVDGDGRIDIVATSTGADGEAIGTYWLQYDRSVRDLIWHAHNIAGPEGIKYDLVHLIDLDADGDLDVLTNDEKEGGPGLGVVWYENPTRSAADEDDASSTAVSRLK